jgi:hypothetical protein
MEISNPPLLRVSSDMEELDRSLTWSRFIRFRAFYLTEYLSRLFRGTGIHNLRIEIRDVKSLIIDFAEEHRSDNFGDQLQPSQKLSDHSLRLQDEKWGKLSLYSFGYLTVPLGTHTRRYSSTLQRQSPEIKLGTKFIVERELIIGNRFYFWAAPPEKVPTVYYFIVQWPSSLEKEHPRCSYFQFLLTVWTSTPYATVWTIEQLDAWPGSHEISISTACVNKFGPFRLCFFGSLRLCRGRRAQLNFSPYWLIGSRHDLLYKKAL